MKNVNQPIGVASIILGALLAIAPALQARTCGGTGDVIGSFGWIGVRPAEFVPATAGTPGPAGSLTQIGALLSGAGNTAAFATVGRAYLDGNGGVFASSTPAGALASVGTYTVDSDCTISVSMTDAFASPGASGVTPVPATANYQGVVVQDGDEIDLTQITSSATSTLTLTKTQQSCAAGNVFSAFGISAKGVSTAPAPTPTSTPTTTGTTTTPTTTGTSTGTGTSTTTTTTSSTSAPTPFSLVGRFVADGAGNLTTDGFGEASPLTSREITGTYTVNVDCTGTATLITSDGTKRGANFVIVTQGPNLTTGTQALQFAFSDTGVVGTGLAQQQ